MMLMRTAKSCGSDAPGLASSLREDAQATVTTKPGHRGEHEVSRKTIAQGRPGLPRCTCGDYARVLYLFRTRGCGCIGHPAFPAPSDYRGANGSCKTSGASRRGNAQSYLKMERRHCEERLVRHQRPRPPKLAEPRRKAEAKQPESPAGVLDCVEALLEG